MDSRELAPAVHIIREGEIIAPGAETPLPAELVATAKAFQTMARAASTRRAYHRAWTDFDAWCRQHGRQSLPASPEAVAAWLAWKARHAMPDAEPGAVPARGSLDKALAAITAAHRATKVPFDRKDPLIAKTWRGVARAVARKRPVRKAEPLLRDRLLRMIGGLRPTVNAEARDAALLALGWGGALRRSELIGLDWQQLGSGTGYVALTPDGVKIVLAVSKTAQDQAVEVVIPKTDMRAAYDALSAWTERAKLQPGFPVFRPITESGIIPKRSADRSQRLPGDQGAHPALRAGRWRKPRRGVGAGRGVQRALIAPRLRDDGGREGGAAASHPGTHASQGFRHDEWLHRRRRGVVAIWPERHL